MIRQVATTTALVLGFLVILLLGGRLIRYFGIAAEGRLDVGLLFSIIGFNLPYFLELLLPLSFFIGLMLVFGRLYVDHEMAVINGSGLSRGYLGRLMTPLIIVLFVIEAGLSLYGKPWGVKQSDAIWQQQALQSAFDLISTKNFVSSGNYHLYVGSMSEDNKQLQDVVLIQTAPKTQDDNSQPNPTPKLDQTEINKLETQAQDASTTTDLGLSETLQQATANNIGVNKDGDNKAIHKYKLEPQHDTLILAKRAEQVQTAGANPTTQLDLYQGRRYEVNADNLSYSQISFERYRISIDKPPKEVVTDDDIATQPLPILWRIARNQPVAFSADSKNINTDNTGMDENGIQINSAGKNDGFDQNLGGAPNPQQILPAQAELGYRLTLPWLIILAPMLAIPLAQVRPRQGRWLRLLPAILIFVSAALVIISLKNSVAKGSSSVWINPLVIIAFMLLALYLNWASRIHHRVRLRFGSKTLNSERLGGGTDG